MAITLLVVSLPLYLWYPKSFKKKYRQNIEKIYAEDGSKGLTGEHEITITNKGIIEKTKYNENKQSWESIEKNN